MLDRKFIKQQLDKILNSTIPHEEKLEKISNIVNVIDEFEAKLAERAKEILLLDPEEQKRLIASTAQDIGIWNPAEIIRKTRESIQSAINRLLNSQNPHGGWGVEWEQSKYWETAWSLLALHEALDITNDLSLPQGMDVAIQRGIDYFRNNNSGWSSKSHVLDHIYSNYDMPLVLRSLYAFKDSCSSDLEKEIRDSIELIVSKQNSDGGWDQNIWSPREYASSTAPIQVYSDVSPTSLVLQTLVCIDPEKYKEPIEKAFQWILKYQNEDGSWDLGSRQPEEEGIYSKQGGELKKGFPTIPKTCDGLQGIFSATNAAYLSLEKYSDRINRAVTWLEAHEKRLFELSTPNMNWSGYDYTSTSITLEVLVNHPDPDLPLRTLNALWLINNQIRIQGSPDDGKWPYEQTPRIVHSLLKFFKKILISPLFLINNKG